MSVILCWTMIEPVVTVAAESRYEVTRSRRGAESPCPDPRTGSSVTLTFEDVDVDSAAKFLGDLTGKVYVVEGSRRVAFDFIAEDIGVDEAEALLLEAARQLGCEVIEGEGAVRIIKPPSAH